VLWRQTELRILNGFERAKQLLSRQAASGIYFISPVLKQRLKEIFGTDDPEQAVKKIITEVQSRGDAALFDYSLKIDRVKLSSLEIGKTEISRAYRQIKPELLSALKLAAGRIRSFHMTQKEAFLSGVAGMGPGTLVRTLERVGVYAPGGTAGYPSTVLMTAIPAKVAGVKEVILATPPTAGGVVSAETLVAADISGVDRVFGIGGAQAIAALAYGTRSIPIMDKICGPGNIFVMLAKKLVYGVVDIDGLQGPSEVVIIADETSNSVHCASDILAQAEHDTLASAILITTSTRLANKVSREVERQMGALKRRTIAAESLANGGIIAVVATTNEAIKLVNLYAPEHLCLMVQHAASYIPQITNASCIFIGDKPTVVLGDYVAGPSHSLPTGGTARFSSPLNVTDFFKYINVVTVNDASLKELGPVAITIARAEGFEAHARAVEKRLEIG
jgi:histidinol dehydrogenase